MLNKGGWAFLTEIGPQEKIDFFYVKRLHRVSESDSSRISPIALVWTVLKLVKIVNDCHMYSKSDC